MSGGDDYEVDEIGGIDYITILNPINPGIDSNIFVNQKDVYFELVLTKYIYFLNHF